MAQSGPHVQLKLKKENIRENQIFFLPILGNYGSGRERVREERKVIPSLYDLWRSGGRNPSSQDLKFIYSTRATRGYQQHVVSPKISGLEKKS